MPLNLHYALFKNPKIFIWIKSLNYMFWFIWLHSALPAYNILHQKLLVHCMYSYPSVLLFITCTSSIYIVHQSSILVNSFCFLLNISENFPNIYKEKNLNGLRYLLQKKYSEVSFERLFFMKFFRVWPLKSQMQYNERRVVQCTCMVNYDTRVSCHVRENKQQFFFHAVWGVQRTVIFTRN